MRTLIDKDTGEIIEKVTRCITDGQIKYLEKRNKYLISKNKDNFIFMTYEACKKINSEKNIFTQSDITRIIYIASYAKNNNKLMLSERIPLTKEKMFGVLGLKSKSFELFYNKIIKHNVIKETDGILYLNRGFAFFGKINEKELNSVTRIYKDNVRLLYNNVSITEHKKLAVFYLLIPFINIRYNIVCLNHIECNKDKISPITVNELSQYFGYSKKRFIEIIRFLGKLKDKNHKPIIKTIVNDESNRGLDTIIVNPRIIYAGDNIKDVEALCPIFNI